MAECEEHVCLDARRHAVVLFGPLARASLLGAGGCALLAAGWPLSVAGAAGLALAALVAVRAVWRWDRTRLVVTSEKLVVMHGTLRRRAAAVRLSRVGAVELEQSVLGRLLGYGTVTAGELEIAYVPEPGRVVALVHRLGR